MSCDLGSLGLGFTRPTCGLSLNATLLNPSCSLGAIEVTLINGLG